MRRLKISMAGLAVFIIGIAVVYRLTRPPSAGDLVVGTPVQFSVPLDTSRAENISTLVITQPSREAVARDSMQAQGRAGELKALQQLATQNLAAALDQVRRLPVKEEQDEALLKVCFAVARTDPAKATIIAWNHQRGTPENSNDGMALENLAKKWATKDFSAALTWANEQSTDENEQRRGWVFKGIVSVLAQKDPQYAADLVVNKIPSGAIQFQSAISVLDQWMERDSDVARLWVAGLPKEGLREALLDYLADDKFYHAPTATSTPASNPADTVARADGADHPHG